MGQYVRILLVHRPRDRFEVLKGDVAVGEVGCIAKKHELFGAFHVRAQTTMQLQFLKKNTQSMEL